MIDIKTQQFIDKARSLYGNRYNYNDVRFVHCMKPVIIICPFHGPFLKRPNNHLSGKQGCQKCSKKYRYSTKEFIDRSQKIHNNKYIYTKTTYINNHTPVIITCSKHGDFKVKPAAHVGRRKAGCQQCGRKNCGAYHKKDTTWFIEKATEIHGTKYDYSYVNYKMYHDKVKIKCPAHGPFFQAATVHINMKSGCPRCSYKEHEGGYGIKRFENHPEIKTNPATLYLIIANNEQEQFIKIGITQKTIKERFTVNNRLPYQYTITLEREGQLYDLFLKEQQLKKQFRKYKYKPTVKFNGHTECFTIDALPSLLTAINNDKR